MLTIAHIISIISVIFIAAEDIRNRTIPDMWLWPLLLAGIFAHGGDEGHVAAAIFGYAIGWILMFALRKKQALGYGDVKLLAAAGLWLGVNGLSVAVVSAAILGIIWGLAKKQKYVPFAPFLLLGAVMEILLELLIIKL